MAMLNRELLRSAIFGYNQAVLVQALVWSLFASTLLARPGQAALLPGACPKSDECGGLILPQYTLCNLKNNEADCYSFAQRKLNQGYRCGPCPTCAQSDMCSTYPPKYFVCNPSTRDLQCALVPFTWTLLGYQCGLCPSAPPSPSPTTRPPTAKPTQYPTPLPTVPGPTPQPTTALPTPQPTPSPTVKPSPYQAISFPAGCPSQTATVGNRQTCTTVNAPSATIPLCDGSGNDPTSNTVEYLFTTPYSSTKNVRAGTCSVLGSTTTFDTIISVWEILSGGSTMKCIGRNDDSGVCSPQSRQTFAAEPGKQYAIYVYGKNGATGTYTFIVEDA